MEIMNPASLVALKYIYRSMSVYTVISSDSDGGGTLLSREGIEKFSQWSYTEELVIWRRK
jgi:hypothetical protein